MGRAFLDCGQALEAAEIKTPQSKRPLLGVREFCPRVFLSGRFVQVVGKNEAWGLVWGWLETKRRGQRSGKLQIWV